ncbi:unnamed protein product [Aspergillus oryzae]|nr:unnamed protein product [Aspergillus oryzae]
MLLLLFVILRKLEAGVVWKKLAVQWATNTREGNSHNTATEEAPEYNIFDGLIKDTGMGNVGIELDMHQLEVTLHHAGHPILDGISGIWSDKNIKIYANKLIDYLGLTPVKDQLVGSTEKRGISGGEQKRLSIALEIVAMPTAIILDEPTPGLDAATALSIMKLLKSISRMGITVICTIHQPRSDIFQLLDDLLILVSGRQVYLGQAARVKEHFKALEYSFPSESNPSDIVMDIVSRWEVGLEPFRHLPPSGTWSLGLRSFPKCANLDGVRRA